MPDPLLVTSVAYKDVLGAESFAIAPGQITILAGKNGTGKSTALQAIQAALGGGSLATLARVDPSGEPTKPEVVLVIEGEGSEAYRIERTGEKVRARARVGDSAAFEDIPRPQAWLSSLFDPSGSNPVRFLTAADKDRAIMLLEALPLAFDRATLLAEMGISAAELGQMGAIPERLHPLEEIALIRDAVFRTRTGVNRDAKAQQASAEQLRRSMPAVLPADITERMEQEQHEVSMAAAELAGEEERAEAALAKVMIEAGSAATAARERLAHAFKTDAAALRRAHEQYAAELRAEVERTVARSLAATEDAIGVLRETAEVDVDKVDFEYRQALAAGEKRREAARVVAAEKGAALVKRREALAALRAQASQGERARALAEQVAKFDQAAQALDAESARLTRAIGALDAHRRRLADNLPIPCLTIEGKVIRVNGVVFEQLNTAQRVEIAVRVATLRARGRRLPVVFVDGAEQLDGEHFEALVAELKAQGVQAFIGRVTDHPLTVEVA